MRLGGGLPGSQIIRAALQAALILLIGAACNAASPDPAPTAFPTVTPGPGRTSVTLHGPLPTATLPPASTAAAMPTEAAVLDDLESGDLPDYYGGTVVTLDYVGQTIFMKPGQGFLLQLGDSFDWEITVDPTEVLTVNQRYVPLEGEQGVWIARQEGGATLRAVGSPICLQNNPPCTRPNVLFTIKVEVEY